MIWKSSCRLLKIFRNGLNELLSPCLTPDFAKAIRDRVKKLDNHNARLKKCDVAAEPDIDDTDSTEKVTIDIGVKRQQFSNEKLLEDELTVRIESGMPVFGMNLKVYKRKGEYGRQYIIPV